MTLEVEGINAGYGSIRVLHDVNLTVEAGRTTAVIGPNGAGKSTLIGALIGSVAGTGRITLDGGDLQNRPTSRRIALGLGYVPDFRGIFPTLTVRENITSASRSRERNMIWDELVSKFPLLAEKHDVRAGQLSGGQQQLVSIARALAGRPKYILLDEPSIGLSPVAIQGVVEALQSLDSLRVGVLLAEQNSSLALRVAHQVIVLGRGRVVWSGPPEDLTDPGLLAALYLGSPKQNDEE